MTLSELNYSIKKNNNMVLQYKDILKKAIESRENLKSCKSDLIASSENLNFGLIVQGNPADNGKISEISTDVDNCVAYLDEVILNTNNKILKLSNRLQSLEDEKKIIVNNESGRQ